MLLASPVGNSSLIALGAYNLLVEQRGSGLIQEGTCLVGRDVGLHSRCLANSTSWMKTNQHATCLVAGICAENSSFPISMTRR